MNEQLSWLTPFSQQVAPGLAWRSKVAKLFLLFFAKAYPIHPPRWIHRETL